MNNQRREKMDSDPGGWLEIVSVWDTIQGEGPFAGSPAVFVRLAGCNLQCPFCFGTAIKGRIPYVSMASEGKKRLDKIVVGDNLLTFNQDLQLTTTTVKAVHSRIVKDWLTLQIDGKAYDVTPEHPFFTKRGLVEAQELRIGDCVLEVKPKEIISWTKQGERNPMKDPDVAKRSAENTDYEKQGRSVAKAIQKSKDKGDYKSAWDRMTPEQQDQCHNKHHQRGWNFWNGSRKDGKELVNKHNGQTVEKITRCSGQLPVVNISYVPTSYLLRTCCTDHN